MSVSRGQFLKSLGKSLPGMLLGGGAAAAKQILDKVAAVSGEPDPGRLMTIRPPSGSLPASGRPAFISQGPSEGNRVALTFDDGPTPGVTDRILDELQRRRLHATFFLIGRHIAAAPDLVRRIFAEGHTVGNHTFTHPRLSGLPDTEVADEMKRTQAAIFDVLNVAPTWFRPPFGAFNTSQAHLAGFLGLRVALWNVDPGDWSQPATKRIAEVVMSQSRAGSIVVCHDVHPTTADAVPLILDHWQTEAMAQVSLDELFR